MYSFSYLEPVCSSMISSNYCFLTCIQIFRRQVRWSSIPISLRIFHHLLWFTQSKAMAYSIKQKMVFWNFPSFFNDPVDVGNLISGSSAFSKSSLNTWKFTVHVVLKPGLENFEDYFASMWDECDCVVVWTFFGIGMKLTFSSPMATAQFSKFVGILSTALSQHHLFRFEIAQLKFKYYLAFKKQSTTKNTEWSPTLWLSLSGSDVKGDVCNLAMRPATLSSALPANREHTSSYV